MKFGVLKDIKNGEYRVVATPAEVSLIAGDGHEVYVASKAGYAAGFDDKEYAAAGATILATNEEIWAICDFVAKVKEIEPSEYDLMREGQMIFAASIQQHTGKRSMRFWKRRLLPSLQRILTDMVPRTVRQQERQAHLWVCGQ